MDYYSYNKKGSNKTEITKNLSYDKDLLLSKSIKKFKDKVIEDYIISLDENIFKVYDCNNDILFIEETLIPEVDEYSDLYSYIMHNYTTLALSLQYKLHENSKFYIDGDVFTVVFEREKHFVETIEKSIEQWTFNEKEYNYYMKSILSYFTAVGKEKGNKKCMIHYIAKNIDLSKYTKNKSSF